MNHRNRDKAIQAKFLTTARAFSADTRTAVTELTVDNTNHSLWPGTYVECRVPGAQRSDRY